MKLTVVISTSESETVWNALRLANFAIDQGDKVSIFLIGAGVEYQKGDSEKFKINDQVEKFISSPQAKIYACTTCLKLRNQEGSETCPMYGLKDLYQLVKESDKVITF
jgi:uncharacterized protein involved in oxidation of intracellular sulfur